MTPNVGNTISTLNLGATPSTASKAEFEHSLFDSLLAQIRPVSDSGMPAIEIRPSGSDESWDANLQSSENDLVTALALAWTFFATRPSSLSAALRADSAGTPPFQTLPQLGKLLMADTTAVTSTAPAGSPGPAATGMPPGSDSAAPTSPVTQIHLSEHIGTAAWRDQLAAALVRDARVGDQQIQLRLNPPELGPVHVLLHVGDDTVQAHFLSPHATARTAIEQAIPQLRDQLAEQGIALDDATVAPQLQSHSNGSQSRNSQSERYGQMPPSVDCASPPTAPSQRLEAGIDVYA